MVVCLISVACGTDGVEDPLGCPAATSAAAVSSPASRSPATPVAPADNGAGLQGRVTWLAEPQEEFAVLVRRLGEEPRMDFVKALNQETYRRALEPGTYYVRATAPGACSPPVRVEVGDGSVDLDLALRPNGPWTDVRASRDAALISGLASDGSGRVVAHALVDASSPMQGATVAWTRADGRFLLEVPPGQYHVRVAQEDGGALTAEVEALAGQVIEVELGPTPTSP